MDKYRVYIIDDHYERYAGLNPLMNALSSKSHGFTFETGFDGSKEHWKDVDSLLEAINDENGIFLLDLEFQDGDPLANDLADRLNEELSSDLAAKLSLEIERISAEDRLGRRTHQQLGRLLMATCVVLGRRVYVISGESSSYQNAALDEHFGLKIIAWPSLWDEEDKISKKAGAAADMIRQDLDWLSRISGSTQSWFRGDFQTNTWLGHHFPPVNLLSDYGDCDRELAMHACIEQHQSVVQSIFPWLPGSWWCDEKGVLSEVATQALHNHMKTLFGPCSFWQGDKYGLSIGGVYLLFLCSCRSVIGEQFNPEARGSIFFENFEIFGAGAEPFQISPNKDIEELMIRTLSDVFRNLILFDPNHARSGQFAVDSVFVHGTDGISFQLEWEIPDSENLANKMNDWIGRLGATEGKVGGIPAQTADAVRRFSLISQCRSVGFGQELGMWLTKTGRLVLHKVVQPTTGV